MNDWKDYQHANCCPCHTTRKVAYSLEEAAARVGVSSRTLKDQITNKYLLARYSGTKALIGHDDLVTWFNNLPVEPGRK